MGEITEALRRATKELSHWRTVAEISADEVVFQRETVKRLLAEKLEWEKFKASLEARCDKCGATMLERARHPSLYMECDGCGGGHA